MKTILSCYTNILQRLIVLIGIVFATFVNAQTFPVQVTPQLIPPYSAKLSDFTTVSNEKLFVNILLTDVNEVNRRVRLKMSIEGQGLSITTRDIVSGATPIFVDGGVNLKTIDEVYNTGIDITIVGSALYGSNNIEQQYNDLLNVH